jgi:spoIIIJ-associated protein
VNEVEVTGKTIEDAKKMALMELGVSEDKVEFTILKKGRLGILGMGADEAKVRARIIDNAGNQDAILTEATSVLEKMVTFMGLDATVKVISTSDGVSPAVLNLEGDDLGVLIGRRGQTLASLQYIVRLIVSEKAKSWISLNIDVAGYKKRRYESLQKLALRLAEQVKTTKRSINLEPMPPDERRMIHIALADNPDISTYSVDEGERRKVVIQYKKR